MGDLEGAKLLVRKNRSDRRESQRSIEQCPMRAYRVEYLDCEAAPKRSIQRRRDAQERCPAQLFESASSSRIVITGRSYARRAARSNATSPVGNASSAPIPHRHADSAVQFPTSGNARSITRSSSIDSDDGSRRRPSTAACPAATSASARFQVTPVRRKRATSALAKSSERGVGQKIRFCTSIPG